MNKYKDREVTEVGHIEFPVISGSGEGPRITHAEIIIRVTHEDGRGVEMTFPKIMLEEPGALDLKLQEYEGDDYGWDPTPEAFISPKTIDLTLKGELSRDARGAQYTLELIDPEKKDA